ncbi:glycosyltransferase family 2 protein [Mycolicibacterium sp. Y3]
MVILSIVMPVYNEVATISRALDRVLGVDYPCPVELVVVDDGSSDGTPDILKSYSGRGVTSVFQPFNRGKGAAVIRGVRHATGTHLLILDADLEYDPADIPRLLNPVIEGISDHIFGARIFGLNTRFPSYRFALGGRFTTVIANALFDSCLTDMHTCLKLIPVEHFRSLTLREAGFGFDTELTATLLRAGVRPYEVPITYLGRTVDEGKKITWRDGLTCLRLLASVRLSSSVALVPGPFRTRPVVVPMRAATIVQRLNEVQHSVIDAATQPAT